ncbi:hypothetical protein LACWKB8_0518 [Lactobacillus sp. wkB8]|nr:hypothetical protein LACWKB8_0518 [Lactobacillus sp. wkB8]
MIYLLKLADRKAKSKKIYVIFTKYLCNIAYNLLILLMCI